MTKGTSGKIDIRFLVPWAECKKHNTKYPRGSKCPKCKAEEERKKR